jgi:threonine/homoserine/homoserine lactone efflux protein
MEYAEKNNGSLFKKILKWAVVGVLALIGLRMVFGLLGFAATLTFFLIFKVGPLALVIWLGWKAWKYFTEPEKEEEA